MRTTAILLTAVFALTFAVQSAPHTIGTTHAMMPAKPHKICKTATQEKMSARLIRAGKLPRCWPKSSVDTSSSRSSISSSGSRSSLSSSASTSVSSAASSVSTDANADTLVRSQFLVLGDRNGPALAGFTVFLYEEPMFITTIRINVSVSDTAIDSFLVYDQDKRLIGRATVSESTPTNRTYALKLGNTALPVAQREERSFYVRPVLMSKDLGGVSGLVVRVQNVVIDGNGAWSNRTYTKLSTDTFPTFQTARGAITSVVNAGLAQEFLLSGTDRKLGTFRFTARKGDGNAQVTLSSIAFQIEQTGNVQVANVKIGQDGDSTRFGCTVANSIATCSNVSAIGVLNDSATFHVYGDVSIPTNTLQAGLRLSINNGGTVTTPGSVTWSDGTNTFSWLPTSSGVVASGTLYKF